MYPFLSVVNKTGSYYLRLYTTNSSYVGGYFVPLIVSLNGTNVSTSIDITVDIYDAPEVDEVTICSYSKGL